jgi:hypothetical protein
VAGYSIIAPNLTYSPLLGLYILVYKSVQTKKVSKGGGGPNLLKGGSKSAEGGGGGFQICRRGGPYLLGDLDRGVQISCDTDYSI